MGNAVQLEVGPPGTSLCLGSWDVFSEYRALLSGQIRSGKAQSDRRQDLLSHTRPADGGRCWWQVIGRLRVGRLDAS
jgi:hypothetical protein